MYCCASLFFAYSSDSLFYFFALYVRGFDGVSFECFLVHDLCTSLIFWLKFSMLLHSVYCSLVALCAVLSSVLRLQV